MGGNVEGTTATFLPRRLRLLQESRPERQLRGLRQAALAYLGKPLADLTDDELAQLVAMIEAPNEPHPLRNRAAYEQRLARVKAVLAGRCAPAGWFDTTCAHCG